MAFDYKKYALAIDMLKEELEQNYDLDDHFLLADAYARINRIDEALHVYGEAIDSETPSTYLLKYANLLKKAQRYEKAISVFQMLKTESSLDALLDAEIKACMKAQRWMDNPDSLTSVKPMTINSSASDYLPILADGRIYFTSDRLTKDNASIYDWTGAGFSDIWMANYKGGDASPLGGEFNTELNESTPVRTPNGKEIYLTRCYSSEGQDAFCKLMYAEKNEEKWGKLKVVEGLDGNFNVMHPTFSSDGQLMFFASDATGGIGGLDIYYCRRLDEGWGRPINLGQMINTEYDEAFPHLFHDTLYFASKGHPGMGGYDIFYSFFGEDGKWIKPVNLETPINSGADDFGIYIDTSEHGEDVVLEGLFSSDRSGGMGRDDIYGFTVFRPLKEEKVSSTPLMLTVKVVKPIYRMQDEPNSGIRRYVPVDSSRIRINNDEYLTDITGVITHEIDSNGYYKITASANGYLSASHKFSSATDLEDGVGYVRLVLTPVFYNREIVLENIYYDFNKWNIREDARPALDSLVNLLNDNPDIAIQLSSHTDCRGDDDFNIDLSQKRANSVVQYLIANGINSDRLTAVGYGEKRPFVDCKCGNCTEEEHQANRRTSFTILDQ